MLVRNADFEQIYAISIELDKLIVEYYNQIRTKKKQPNAKLLNKR
ncbi:Spo0E family sporulation regulatory protein-aspartic acid phosphatase [Petroclostridium xylanilyticum]|nr:Spo0E family sporulation regulatory protein-aspartic acid phosphatase [Petroclostridium xylanilyticum]